MNKDSETRNLIAALDIGTSKIIALIGEVKPDGSLEVIGVGMHESLGMENDLVIDIDAAVYSIQRAVSYAELMAGCKVHEVYTCISGSHIRSSNSNAMVKIKDGNVSQADIDRVIEVASSISLPSDQYVVQIITLEFCVDKQEGIKNPLGMSGMRLEVELFIVVGAVEISHNIMKRLDRCELKVNKVILQTLASSKAVLSEDDKKLGVCLVDIGAETTNIAIFTQGAIRQIADIPIAGNQITHDIAKALCITTKDAEEIKIKYGCALSQLLEDTPIEVHSVNGQGSRVVRRQILAEIIEPRVRELFKRVHTELHRSGHYYLLNAGIVITGGGSIMQGMVKLGEDICHMPVRLGIPRYVGRLSDEIKSAQFSTAVGLLMIGLDELRINIKPDAKQGMVQIT